MTSQNAIHIQQWSLFVQFASICFCLGNASIHDQKRFGQSQQGAGFDMPHTKEEYMSSRQKRRRTRRTLISTALLKNGDVNLELLIDTISNHFTQEALVEKLWIKCEPLKYFRIQTCMSSLTYQLWDYFLNYQWLTIGRWLDVSLSQVGSFWVHGGIEILNVDVSNYVGLVHIYFVPFFLCVNILLVSILVVHISNFYVHFMYWDFWDWCMVRSAYVLLEI